MSRHIALLRVAGAAALTLAGITASTGAAHAATSISCSFGATGGPGFAVVNGCGSFTISGAPYTVFLSQYTDLPLPPLYPITVYNVTITCQGFAPAGGGLPAGDYDATNCTNPF